MELFSPFVLNFAFMKYNQLTEKSPTEILSLYARYKAGEKNRILLDELGLTDTPDSLLYKLFQNIRVNNLGCPICSNPMLATLPSKKSMSSVMDYACISCQHVVFADIEGNEVTQNPNCRCDVCVAVVKKNKSDLQTSFIEKIRKEYHNQGSVSHSDISSARLTDLVGLNALINTWSSEDMTHFVPLSAKSECFWPTKETSYRSFSEIYQHNLINIDLDHCTTDNFNEEPDGSISWYIKRAPTTPSIRTTPEYCMDISCTQGYLRSYFTSGLSNKQKEELPDLMRIIAVNECIQFMQQMLSNYRFEYELGDKTQQLFADLLIDLSVSQVLL
jgi:hypothetical protein